MGRYLCVHGHFYQPPRENPWLEEVEIQESAYPYHDWNQRVTAECYAPNAAARILDQKEKIIQIVNNYSRMSFNFGPSLLSWMERNDPEVYQAILNADKESQKKFSGHGSALAQCYSHMIMPLANSRDKRTQILWGIRDFENRFQRKPEGMWLPETAADLESFEMMAEEGIKFTILAPHQARQIKKIGDTHFEDVSGQRIDPRKPYVCLLPGGKTIGLFFYDGHISRDVAFGGLLGNGGDLAARLLGAFSNEEDDQLVHISTDGETFGHHHNMGDMALAYALEHIETNGLAQITNYSEFLENHPPEDEVEIFENSSWSCVHGVERWRNDCGCQSGGSPGWNQQWRAPLREGMDNLRDQLMLVFEEQGNVYLKDVWNVRDHYIHVILDRSKNNVDKFLAQNSRIRLNKDEKSKVLKLLEMQRCAMLMYTSCGWFFSEISGIETIQIISYAAKAIQLVQEFLPVENELEKSFIQFLEKASSNIPKYANGANIYEKHVRPSVLDLVRVGAHYAVSSLFEEYPDATRIYCYTANSQLYDRLEIGKQKLAVGKVLVTSEITLEEELITFAVLQLGDHNLFGGVRKFVDEKFFLKMHQEIKDAFRKNDIEETTSIIKKSFDGGQYSLWHLFKDEQSKVLYQILDSTLEKVEESLREINEHHYPIIQVIKQLHIPLPKFLANTVLVMINTDFLRVLGSDVLNAERLKDLVAEVIEWSLEIDRVTIEFIARRRISDLMEAFLRNPGVIDCLEQVNNILCILAPLALDIDLWRVQNIYFFIGNKTYPRMKLKAEKGNKKAIKWIEVFDQLGEFLQVRIT